MKAWILLGFLDGSVEFTPLEDWIGIVRIGRREMNLTSFFFGVYVSIYYLKNQIIYDKL